MQLYSICHPPPKFQLYDPVFAQSTSTYAKRVSLNPSFSPRLEGIVVQVRNIDLGVGIIEPIFLTMALYDANAK